MEYQSIVQIERKGKIIAFFLKEGTNVTISNIVDVAIHEMPNEIKYLPQNK